MAVVMVLGGAALLYFGGETLVVGAVNLSRRYGLSPLLIGLTVVAFGTSTPELASSLIAAGRGSGGIAAGNVIGSNIANIGLILGAAAVVFPITATARFLRRELPILIGVSLLLPWALWDGNASLLEGVLLVALLLPYFWILATDRETPQVDEEFAREYGAAPSSSLLPIARVAIGIVMLTAGASALVDGAVTLARAFGVSERVIGITLVAFGTSLPELATSLVAALRREGDIALGNVVGSNVFNILMVLGTTAAVMPFAVDTTALLFDTAVMLAFALALVPFIATGRRIGRIEGASLVAGYGTYVGYLFASS